MLMPASRLDSGLEATARILSPMRVFCKSSQSSRHSTASTTIRAIVELRISVPARSTRPAGQGAGICCGSVPKRSWASELMARNMPSVTITTLSGLRPSSTGRISTRSMTAPPTKASAIDRRTASTTGISPVNFQLR